MTRLILALTLIWLGYLAAEEHQVSKARRQITHVVHVNGTRGKSTVCRLIEAGLRAGGMRVFCKTTGTDPMTMERYPVHRGAGSGVTETFKLSQYNENLAGTVCDVTVYVMKGEKEGGSVLLLGGTHPSEPAGHMAAAAPVYALHHKKR